LEGFLLSEFSIAKDYHNFLTFQELNGIVTVQFH
jgi:hypothetical protein